MLICAVTIDDLEQFSPPTSPIVGMDRSLKVDAIQLEFGAMETQVVFTSDPGKCCVRIKEWLVSAHLSSMITRLWWLAVEYLIRLSR